MKRIGIGLFIVFAAVWPAAAQDMPLSQILIDGEGWKAGAGGAPPAPIFSNPASVTSRKGYAYSVDAKGRLRQQRVNPADPAWARAAAYDGLVRPSCVALWPDEGHLVVGDAGGKHLWAFRVEADGRIGPGDRYYSLRVPPGQQASGVTAMTFDAASRLYACTPLGVQVFDPTGRLSGVLLKPADGPLMAIAFGGADREYLLVACGDKVYGRRLNTKGVPPGK
jgi:sugar lactone lactonase YvrE